MSSNYEAGDDLRDDGDDGAGGDDPGGLPGGRIPRPPLPRDEWVSRVIADPANPPQAVLLSGYVGDAAEPGRTRIYSDAALGSYVEIDDGDVLHHEPLESGGQPAGGVLVWVHSEAVVTPGIAGEGTGGGGAEAAQAGFFTGPVLEQNRAPGLPGGPGPVKITLLTIAGCWSKLFCPTIPTLPITVTKHQIICSLVCQDPLGGVTQPGVHAGAAAAEPVSAQCHMSYGHCAQGVPGSQACMVSWYGCVTQRKGCISYRCRPPTHLLHCHWTYYGACAPEAEVRAAEPGSEACMFSYGGCATAKAGCPSWRCPPITHQPHCHFTDAAAVAPAGGHHLSYGHCPPISLPGCLQAQAVSAQCHMSYGHCPPISLPGCVEPAVSAQCHMSYGHCPPISLPGCLQAQAVSAQCHMSYGHCPPIRLAAGEHGMSTSWHGCRVTRNYCPPLGPATVHQCHSIYRCGLEGTDTVQAAAAGTVGPTAYPGCTTGGTDTVAAAPVGHGEQGRPPGAEQVYAWTCWCHRENAAQAVSQACTLWRNCAAPEATVRPPTYYTHVGCQPTLFPCHTFGAAQAQAGYTFQPGCHTLGFTCTIVNCPPPPTAACRGA